MTNAKTAVPLAEIKQTRMLPRRTRSGQTGLECWAARTTDGIWKFERQETAGTPWAVIHAATGTVVDWYVGTLDDCRAYVASGAAEEDLERLQAHDRGEHEDQRDKECPKC